MTGQAWNNKGESDMRHLRTLAPWIAYPAAAGFLGWRTGAVIALAVTVVGVARDARAAASDTFRAAALVFFGTLSIVALCDPTAALHRFVPALIPAALAVAASLSIASGHPFTVTFARRVAPREYWDTPLFAHINVALSAVWAASFAATAVAIAITLDLAPHATAIILATQIVAFVVPMRITRSYPARARARYAGATA
jgi:hypothetical protein